MTMKLLAAITIFSTIALGQGKDALKGNNAMRCEKSETGLIAKCAINPEDNAAIAKLLKDIETKESRIRQQEARIQYLEKQVRLMPEKSHAVGTVERKKAK